MTNRAVMQQALEALHYSKVEAITALREALEQPQQQAEPCIGKDPQCPCQDGDACHYKDCGSTKALPVPVAQPEQEPSAWREMVVVTLVREGIDKHRARELADHFAAQRPWQGLTDDDWDKVGDMPDTFDQGAAWAQARLKERNNG